MKSLEEHCAAMAAALIDDELVWRLKRVPAAEQRTHLDEALIKEAERRGLDDAKPAPL